MKQDKYIGLGLVVFAVVMYHEAGKLPPGLFGGLGAGFVPKIWFILLAVCSALLSLSAMAKEAKARREGAAGEVASGDRETFWVHYKFVIAGFIAFFAYIWGMSLFGYLISTLVFMPVLMWILGPKTKRSAAISLGVSAGATLGIYFVFQQLLKVFLPEGSLF